MIWDTSLRNPGLKDDREMTFKLADLTQNTQGIANIVKALGDTIVLAVKTASLQHLIL